MTRLASSIALAACLNACAGTTNTHAVEHTPTSPRGEPSGPVGNQAPRSRGYAAEGQALPAAPAGGSAPAEARDDAYGARAEESTRPGLGTEWGETQASRVSNASFDREDWRTPSGVATLHYNDNDGVRAMTRGTSWASAPSGGALVWGGALSVHLLDASGQPLPTLDFGSRTYVMGNHGNRYVIQIRNNTAQRFEAVATVDGLDVMDGRPGSFEKRGYLVAPGSTLQIDGFRRSMEEVAAFRFGSVERSYASMKGDDRNVGVVGVAFFSERGAGSRFLDHESERRHGADPFPGRFASPP